MSVDYLIILILICCNYPDTDDWKRTVEIAKAACEYGDTLNLSCLKHSNPALVKKPEDFMKLSPKGVFITQVVVSPHCSTQSDSCYCCLNLHAHDLLC